MIIKNLGYKEDFMRKLAVLLMTGAMVFGLTACGGGDISYDVEPDDVDVEDSGEDVYSEEVNMGDDVYYDDEDQIGDEAAAGYYDTWQSTADQNFFYKFDETGTWYTWNERSNDENSSGSFELKDGNLVLYDRDGNLFETLLSYDDNTLVDSNGSNVVRYSEVNDSRENYGNPMANTSYEFDWDNDGPLTDIIGEWVYLGYYTTPAKDGSSYIFEDNGSYGHYDASGNLLDSGSFEIDPNGDYFMTDLYLNSDSGESQTFAICIDGDLLIRDEDDYYLFRVEYK